MTAPNFPSLLQRFFTDRLLGQLGASRHTVAGYRDTFRLLLRFAVKLRRRPPSHLRIEELDASFVGKFLDHLEHERHNSVRTRNTRLAALHASSSTSHSTSQHSPYTASASWLSRRNDTTAARSSS
jgi:hypothetical protein